MLLGGPQEHKGWLPLWWVVGQGALRWGPSWWGSHKYSTPNINIGALFGPQKAQKFTHFKPKEFE